MLLYASNVFSRMVVISVMSGRGTLMFWKYSLYVTGRLNVSPTKIMFVVGWVGSPV